MPKAPAEAVETFAVPQPSAPSALAFQEFQYVLRARAAMESAQLRDARDGRELLWRDAQGGAEEPQLCAFMVEDGDELPLPEDADYDGGSSLHLPGCCYSRPESSWQDCKLAGIICSAWRVPCMRD